MGLRVHALHVPFGNEMRDSLMCAVPCRCASFRATRCMKQESLIAPEWKSTIRAAVCVSVGAWPGRILLHIRCLLDIRFTSGFGRLRGYIGPSMTVHMGRAFRTRHVSLIGVIVHEGLITAEAMHCIASQSRQGVRLGMPACNQGRPVVDGPMALFMDSLLVLFERGG
jgi:hypothetical protein